MTALPHAFISARVITGAGIHPLTPNPPYNFVSYRYKSGDDGVILCCAIELLTDDSEGLRRTLKIFSIALNPAVLNGVGMIEPSQG
jgi:hypothetical protein